MKRIIYLLLLALVLCKTATAQTVSVPDVEVVPGGTAYYSLNMNIGDREPYGFFYEIQFPATGFSTPASNKSTVHPSWDGGIKPSNLVAGEGNLAGISMTAQTIPSGDIEIGTVAFTVAADVPTGEYDVTIFGFTFILPGAVGYVLPDPITFKVKVVNTLTVVLDENSTEAPTA